MQNLAGVAHSKVDLSVFPELPAADDETGLFSITYCDLTCMVHHHIRRRLATIR